MSQLCRTMTDTAGGTPLERLALTVSTGDCLSVAWEDRVEYLRETGSAAKAVKEGDWQWAWQTCPEFGWYQTTDGKRQPFGAHVPLRFLEDTHCKKVYETSFRSIDMETNDTNIIFGGRTIEKTADWIMFLNGDADPWSALSVLNSTNPTCPAIVIPNASHCERIYSPNSKDSPAINEAHEQITAFIARILSKP